MKLATGCGSDACNSTLGRVSGQNPPATLLPLRRLSPSADRSGRSRQCRPARGHAASGRSLSANSEVVRHTHTAGASGLDVALDLLNSDPTLTHQIADGPVDRFQHFHIHTAAFLAGPFEVLAQVAGVKPEALAGLEAMETINGEVCHCVGRFSGTP